MTWRDARVRRAAVGDTAVNVQAPVQSCLVEPEPKPAVHCGPGQHERSAAPQRRHAALADHDVPNALRCEPRSKPFRREQQKLTPNRLVDIQWRQDGLRRQHLWAGKDGGTPCLGCTWTASSDLYIYDSGCNTCIQVSEHQLGLTCDIRPSYVITRVPKRRDRAICANRFAQPP